MADNAIGAWLQAAGRVPLLSAAEELHLGALIRRWQDWPGGPDAAPAAVRRRGLRARERVITANLRLVATIARKYRTSGAAAGLDFADLLQEGSIGLARAAERFDPATGYKFSTYAYWWIRQGIGRAVDGGGLIRVPGSQTQRLRRLTAAEVETLPAGQREQVLAAAAAGRICSIDAAVRGGDGTTPLAELLPADLPDPLAGVDAMQQVTALRAVAPDDVALVEQALRDGTAAVATALGVKRCRANQRIRCARERLQRLAG